MLLGKNIHFILIFLITLLLSGCIRTLEINNDLIAKNKLSQITPNNPTSHLEYLFYEEFNQTVGSSTKNKAYKLDYSLKVSNTQTLTISQNSSNLEYTDVTIVFKVIDNNSGEIIHKGKISSEATSGAVASLYGQSQSSKFARERLAVLLAQRVYQNLYLYFLENVTQ